MSLAPRYNEYFQTYRKLMGLKMKRLSEANRKSVESI